MVVGGGQRLPVLCLRSKTGVELWLEGAACPEVRMLGLTTSQSLPAEPVSFPDDPDLCTYLTCKKKPLFLFRDILPILLGPDFVHSCLGASETLFLVFFNLIRLSAARGTEGCEQAPH